MGLEKISSIILALDIVSIFIIMMIKSLSKRVVGMTLSVLVAKFQKVQEFPLQNLYSTIPHSILLL